MLYKATSRASLTSVSSVLLLGNHSCLLSAAHPWRSTVLVSAQRSRISQVRTVSDGRGSNYLLQLIIEKTLLQSLHVCHVHELFLKHVLAASVGDGMLDEPLL